MISFIGPLQESSGDRQKGNAVVINRNAPGLSVLLAGVLCLSPPALAQNAPGGPVLRYQLASGTTVVLQNVPDLPAAAVSLTVAAGSSNDPVNRPGLCALTAQLLSRQTQHHASGSLLVDYEQIGARFGHRTLEDRCVFWEVVPRQQIGWAVEVELERLHGTIPSQTLLESEMGAVQQNWDYRAATGQGAALARLFPGVSALAPVLPSVTETEQFRLQNFRPQDAVLTVVGTFDRAQLLKGLPPGPTRAAGSPERTSSHPANSVVDVPGGRALEWIWPLPQVPRANLACALWAHYPPAGCRAEIDRTEGLFRLTRPLLPSEDAEAVEAGVKRDWGTRLFAPVPADALATLKSAARQSELHDLDDLGSRAVAFGLDQSRSGLQCLSQEEALSADDLSQLAGASLRMDLAVELRPVAGSRPEVVRSALAPAAAARGTRTDNPPTFHDVPGGAPAFQRLERPDGSVALVQTVHDLPLVSIRGYLMGGSLLDTPELAGRAEMLAELLHQREPSLRVTAEPNYLLLEGTVARERLAEWLRALAAALKLDPQEGPELERARERVLVERNLESPDQLAYERWRSLLYPGDHPWGRSPNLSHVTAARLRELFDQVRQSGRLTLALSGDLSAADANQALNDALPPTGAAGARADSLLTASTAEHTPEAPVRLKGPRLVLVGRVGPSRKERDFYAFNLLSQVLAGESVSSRLARRLIDREDLASAVTARIQAGLRPMPWVVSARPLEGQSEAVLQAIDQEIARLATEPPTAGEIERAVHALEGELAVSQANSGGRAAALRNLELFHLSDGYLDGYAGAYRAVKPEELKEVAKRWFGKGEFATLVVEP